MPLRTTSLAEQVPVEQGPRTCMLGRCRRRYSCGCWAPLPAGASGMMPAEHNKNIIAAHRLRLSTAGPCLLGALGCIRMGVQVRCALRRARFLPVLPFRSRDISQVNAPGTFQIPHCIVVYAFVRYTMPRLRAWHQNLLHRGSPVARAHAIYANVNFLLLYAFRSLHSRLHSVMGDTCASSLGSGWISWKAGTCGDAYKTTGR